MLENEPYCGVSVMLRLSDTHTTAYPMRRAVIGEQWSEKLGSKRMAKSTPPSPVEKVSTSEIVDTEEEIQFKRPIRRTSKENYRPKMILKDIQHRIYS